MKTKNILLSIVAAGIVTSGFAGDEHKKNMAKKPSKGTGEFTYSQEKKSDYKVCYEVKAQPIKHKMS